MLTKTWKNPHFLAFPLKSTGWVPMTPYLRLVTWHHDPGDLWFFTASDRKWWTYNIIEAFSKIVCRFSATRGTAHLTPTPTPHLGKIRETIFWTTLYSVMSCRLQDYVSETSPHFSLDYDLTVCFNFRTKAVLRDLQLFPTAQQGQTLPDDVISDVDCNTLQPVDDDPIYLMSDKHVCTRCLKKYGVSMCNFTMH